jgi:hypothetical protein
VGEDDLVALANPRQLFDRVDDVVLLDFGRGLLTSLEKRVSA